MKNIVVYMTNLYVSDFENDHRYYECNYPGDPDSYWYRCFYMMRNDNDLGRSYTVMYF